MEIFANLLREIAYPLIKFIFHPSHSLHHVHGKPIFLIYPSKPIFHSYFQPTWFTFPPFYLTTPHFTSIPIFLHTIHPHAWYPSYPSLTPIILLTYPSPPFYLSTPPCTMSSLSLTQYAHCCSRFIIEPTFLHHFPLPFVSFSHHPLAFDLVTYVESHACTAVYHTLSHLPCFIHQTRRHLVCCPLIPYLPLYALSRSFTAKEVTRRNTDDSMMSSHLF